MKLKKGQRVLVIISIILSLLLVGILIYDAIFLNSFDLTVLLTLITLICDVVIIINKK